MFTRRLSREPGTTEPRRDWLLRPPNRVVIGCFRRPPAALSAPPPPPPAPAGPAGRCQRSQRGPCLPAPAPRQLGLSRAAPSPPSKQPKFPQERRPGASGLASGSCRGAAAAPALPGPKGLHLSSASAAAAGLNRLSEEAPAVEAHRRACRCEEISRSGGHC